MRLILLGPPGSGKGTQAKLLCKRLRLAHIGTGDILRQAIREETPSGKLAKPFVESGQLVPDEVVNQLVAECFQRPDRPDRFIMDGYPRTRAQAINFDKVLKAQNLPLDAVVLLDVADEEIVRRVSGRWSCPKPGCKATYHIDSNPPKIMSVCDDCGTALIQRTDDRVDTVQERLRVYRKDTIELIPYYRQHNLLHAVAGFGNIEEIYNHLLQVLQP